MKDRFLLWLLLSLLCPPLNPPPPSHSPPVNGKSWRVFPCHPDCLFYTYLAFPQLLFRYTCNSKEYLRSSSDCDPSVRHREAVLCFSFEGCHILYAFYPQTEAGRYMGVPVILLFVSMTEWITYVVSMSVRQMFSKPENAFLWHSMLHFYESLHLDTVFHNVFLKTPNLYSAASHLLLL